MAPTKADFKPPTRYKPVLTVLARRDANPSNDFLGSDVCFVFPRSDAVDDFIADVVGNPLSV